MIPTFEEYEKGIKDRVYKYLRNCADKEELQKYLVSDEVNNEIKGRYTDDLEDYHEGRFRDIAWKGKEASVAYCLYLMF